MRELPEHLAHYDTTSSSEFSAPMAPNHAQGMATAATFLFCGYLIGDESDPLLCGHPDLVY
jgi:hypothetical protein